MSSVGYGTLCFLFGLASREPMPYLGGRRVGLEYLFLKFPFCQVAWVKCALGQTSPSLHKFLFQILLTPPSLVPTGLEGVMALLSPASGTFALP